MGHSEVCHSHWTTWQHPRSLGARTFNACDSQTGHLVRPAPAPLPFGVFVPWFGILTGMRCVASHDTTLSTALWCRGAIPGGSLKERGMDKAGPR